MNRRTTALFPPDPKEGFLRSCSRKGCARGCVVSRVLHSACVSQIGSLILLDLGAAFLSSDCRDKFSLDFRPKKSLRFATLRSGGTVSQMLAADSAADPLESMICL